MFLLNVRWRKTEKDLGLRLTPPRPTPPRFLRGPHRSATALGFGSPGAQSCLEMLEGDAEPVREDVLGYGMRVCAGQSGGKTRWRA